MPIGLASLGKPEGFLARQVKGWTDRFERAKTSEQPVAQELSSWLLAELPESPPPTLVHNDWKLDNMAVAADDPGPLRRRLRLGHVHASAIRCAISARCSGSGAIPARVSPAAIRCRRRRPASCHASRPPRATRERSGRDVSRLPYYVVFGTFKMGVVLQQIYFRFHRGQTQDQRFAGMGKLAEGLFQLAADRRP